MLFQQKLDGYQLIILIGLPIILVVLRYPEEFLVVDKMTLAYRVGKSYAVPPNITIVQQNPERKMKEDHYSLL